MADNITYTDKEQGIVNPAPTVQKYTFQDANEVKTVVNANADELTTAQGDINTNAADIILNTNAIDNIETKTDFITVTQAVDLDTMESNISTNSGDISTAQATADAALPKAGGTLTGAILGDQPARLYRPQSEASLSVDTDLDTLTPNTRILINTAANSVTITATDLANTTFPTGTVFEFIWRVGSNDAIFAIEGSQQILSADDNLKMRIRYCGATLSKEINNTWYLIGDLKA